MEIRAVLIRAVLEIRAVKLEIRRVVREGWVVGRGPGGPWRLQ